MPETQSFLFDAVSVTLPSLQLETCLFPQVSEVGHLGFERGAAIHRNVDLNDNAFPRIRSLLNQSHSHTPLMSTDIVFVTESIWEDSKQLVAKYYKVATLGKFDHATCSIRRIQVKLPPQIFLHSKTSKSEQFKKT